LRESTLFPYTTLFRSEADDLARRGNFWDGAAVSSARVCVGISVVAMDGFAARGRAKHPRAFHDADGSIVLGHGSRRRRRGESSEDRKSTRLNSITRSS